MRSFVLRRCTIRPRLHKGRQVQITLPGKHENKTCPCTLLVVQYNGIIQNYTNLKREVMLWETKKSCFPVFSRAEIFSQMLEQSEALRKLKEEFALELT